MSFCVLRPVGSNGLIFHKVALIPLQTPQLIWHPNSVPWTMPPPSTSGNVVTQQRGKMLK